MEKLSIDKYLKYLGKEGYHYIYNPRLDRAYRFDQGEDMEVLERFRGGNGLLIKPNDKEFNEAWRFGIVMTQQEYEDF